MVTLKVWEHWGSEEMLTNHRELQQCLGETGVKSLFKHTPGFSLGFTVPKTGHQVGGLRNVSFIWLGLCHICFALSSTNWHFKSLSLVLIFWAWHQFISLWANIHSCEQILFRIKGKKTLETLSLQHQEEKYFQNCYKQELQVSSAVHSLLLCSQLFITVCEPGLCVFLQGPSFPHQFSAVQD